MNLNNLGLQKIEKKVVLKHMHIHTYIYIYWVVVSNIFYFHPEPWENDPI